MILRGLDVMRVVAGKYRHRLISFPNDSHVRPTKDRIREALFSALGDLEGLNILDLYAGSGAMGIEALSRNALHATFVDNNSLSIKVIKENIKSLGINNAEILYKNDLDALEMFKKENRLFDLVILDPPYQEGKYIEIISYLINNNLLSNNARIVTECNYELDFNSLDFKKIKTYHYGEIIINVLYLSI